MITTILIGAANSAWCGKDNPHQPPKDQDLTGLVLQAPTGKVRALTRSDLWPNQWLCQDLEGTHHTKGSQTYWPTSWLKVPHSIYG